METQVQKVYVAVGNDIRDGYKTLAWTLRKWSPQPFSIVLLHVTYNISKDFVYTPFGKLPASAVSEEKLEILRKYEQEKTDKLLSKRSKSAISGAFYVHQNKPGFCELYIICGEKLVVLGGNVDEGRMENDPGIMVAKHLLSLNLDEDTPMESNTPGSTNSNMNDAEEMEAVQCKIDEAQETIHLKRKEAIVDAERQAKAEWAIILCNSRAEELETLIKVKAAPRLEMNNLLDTEKQKLYEVIKDVEESKNRLNSLKELQAELSSKLQESNKARANAEAQLEKAEVTTTEMVRKIEELRRQRDVFQRRIEFCREKDALGTAARSSELRCSYREYTAEDVRSATNNFSELSPLKSCGDWLNVYRGQIEHSTVVIMMLGSDNGMCPENFQAKVRLLSDIRHPHLVALMGFCSELTCIIYEYMHNSSLRDILFAPQRSCRKTNKNQVLMWYDRIRIAREVCMGLGFLHSSKPRPIVHGQLTTSNVLLDRNLVAKISGYGFRQYHDHYDLSSDIWAFGVLLMHMLTGGTWAGLIEDGMMVDRAALVRILDEKAGNWPLELAVELSGISLKCMSVSRDLQIATVMEELNELQKKADVLVGRGGIEVVSNENVNMEDTNDVPSAFLCPVFKEVMKNPHVAADGFSYELEAIEEWLTMGHDTSPMTNLRLKHKFLTPNHTLRALIHDWQNKRSNLSC
ncbi:hypothetical protein V6N13_126875 [Hibiscus sabdariffa]